MACLDLQGFEHAESDGDVMKFEFGFNKPNNDVFSSNSGPTPKTGGLPTRKSAY